MGGPAFSREEVAKEIDLEEKHFTDISEDKEKNKEI